MVPAPCLAGRSVRQQGETRTGLSASDDGQEHIPTTRSRPFTEFLHKTDAVTDGNQNHFHARIGCDHLIEGTDR